MALDGITILDYARYRPQVGEQKRADYEPLDSPHRRERVLEMEKRYAAGRDIYTGVELKGAAREDWEEWKKDQEQTLKIKLMMEERGYRVPPKETEDIEETRE